MSREIFLRFLRSDLNHLYDPDFLRESPLLELFNLSERFDAPFALQKTLTSAIEALRPASGEPGAAQRKRVYELLQIRYIQQASQSEVATQFGVSVRQVRREQQAAVELLGAYLWNQFNLNQEQVLQSSRTSQKPQGTSENQGIELQRSAPMAAEHTSLLSKQSDSSSSLDTERELAWLRGTAMENPADPNLLLPEVLELVQPLANRKELKVLFEAVPGLPVLAVRRVALRQTMLNLLTLAIQLTCGPVIELRVDGRPAVSGSFLRMELICPASAHQTLDEEGLSQSLDMVSKMIEIFGGKVTVTLRPDEAKAEQTTVFHASLMLPVLEPLEVLVIDDNPDFFQLMHRFTEDTRYRVTGVQQPELAVQIVREMRPAILVMDVMMPHMDGWQVLAALKNDPQVAQIPVVICTIFAQKDLALALGADDFVQKPVTQENLRAALDRQAARLAPANFPTSGYRPSDH